MQNYLKKSERWEKNLIANARMKTNKKSSWNKCKECIVRDIYESLTAPFLFLFAFVSILHGLRCESECNMVQDCKCHEEKKFHKFLRARINDEWLKAIYVSFFSFFFYLINCQAKKLCKVIWTASSQSEEGKELFRIFPYAFQVFICSFFLVHFEQ